jgi:hypothetical protein
LRKAVYNYMHAMGLQEDVRRWFDQRPGRRVPRPQVAADLVEQALMETPARRRSRRSADR